MKLIYVLLLILAGSVVAGIYGALYDQLTFTISPEFFVKYRFLQTQFLFTKDYSPRMGAAIVGFYNTWKAGLLIGTVLSLVGLISRNTKVMVRSTIIAFIVTLSLSLLVGLIGWSVSPLQGQANPDIELQIVDAKAFKTVENMNNFSYAGAVIGMFIGVFFQIYIHNRYRISSIEEELQSK